MKKRLWLLPVKLAAVLALGIALGFVLLIGVFALPIEPMAQNVRASVPALNGDWAFEESYRQLVPGYMGTQLDTSTDAAMLLAAVHESDLPLTTRVAESYRYIAEGNAYAALMAYGDPEAELPSAPIARYWHGYLLWLKPLLLFLSYLDIRMLLTIVQGALLAAIIAGLCKRRQEALIPAFLLSLLCITPTATALSMQYSTALCTCLLAMAGLLYLPRKAFSPQGTAVYFLLTGMLTSYMDYLTYPVVTFGLPFVLYLFLFPAESARQEWLRFIGLGVCWCAGYFGMWAGKWMIAGCFGNEEWFWPNLLASITERSSELSGDLVLSYGDVLKSVLSAFVKKAYLLAGAAATLAWGVIFLRRKGPRLLPWARLSVLLAVAVIPFAWYFCTKNHSYNHAFYTSRSLAVSVFAFASLMACLLPAKKQEKP